MEFGVLVDEPVKQSEFDLTFYEAKQATGRFRPFPERLVNIVSCFMDNLTIHERPDRCIRRAASHQDE